MRAGVEQLVGGAALGRLEAVSSSLASLLVPRSSFAPPPRITKPLVHRQDERFTPAVPPAFAQPSPARALVVALTGDARAGSPAAHGWYSMPDPIAGLPAVARLSGDPVVARRVPIDAFCP